MGTNVALVWQYLHRRINYHKCSDHLRGVQKNPVLMHSSVFLYASSYPTALIS